MGNENRKLLEKADLVLADFSTGGLLNAAEADRFIRMAVNQSAFMAAMCTVRGMRSWQENIPKTRFSGRVLHKGTEASALPVGSRAKPTMSNVVLNCSPLKAEVRMSDESLEDNIEKGSFFQTVMQMLTEAIARDLDTLVINGDTTNASDLVSTFDGVLKLATSNTVNGSSARLSKGILRDTFKAVDDVYANDPSLKYATSRQAKIDFRDSLSERQTALGDAALLSQQMGSQYQDIPIIVIPEFPPTTETGGSNTQLLLASPANHIVGIWRQIRVELDRDVSAGETIIVSSMRVGTQIIETTAEARAYDVLST